MRTTFPKWLKQYFNKLLTINFPRLTFHSLSSKWIKRLISIKCMYFQAQWLGRNVRSKVTYLCNHNSVIHSHKRIHFHSIFVGNFFTAFFSSKNILNISKHSPFSPALRVVHALFVPLNSTQDRRRWVSPPLP